MKNNLIHSILLIRKKEVVKKRYKSELSIPFEAAALESAVQQVSADGLGSMLLSRKV